MLLVALLSCGSDSTAPAPIEGTYTLQTINGQSLPVVVAQTASEKDEVTAATITLSSGGVFTLDVTLRQMVGAQASTMTSTSNGTWTRSGATLTMATTGTGSTAATLTGNTLTIPGVGGLAGVVPWVFRK